nr:hypothetical protein [Nostoc sp. EkiNYC01]
MITKNQQNPTRDLTSGTNTEVPAVNPNERSPSITPTLYDCLALLPALITATTPLILRLTTKSHFLRKHQSRGKQKQERQQITENNNDVSD